MDKTKALQLTFRFLAGASLGAGIMYYLLIFIF